MIAVGYSFNFAQVKALLLLHTKEFVEIKKELDTYTDEISARMHPIKIGWHYGSKARLTLLDSDSLRSDDYLASWYTTKKNKESIKVRVSELYVTKGKKHDIVFGLLNDGKDVVYGALYNPNNKSTFVQKKQLTGHKNDFFHTIKLEPAIFLDVIPYTH